MYVDAFCLTFHQCTELLCIKPTSVLCMFTSTSGVANSACTTMHPMPPIMQTSYMYHVCTIMYRDNEC